MRIDDGIRISGNDFISILMIGQSNMAGRGALDELPPIKNPDCFMLRNGRWQPMTALAKILSIFISPLNYYLVLSPLG